jgi:hypothetical protein
MSPASSRGGSRNFHAPASVAMAVNPIREEEQPARVPRTSLTRRCTTMAAREDKHMKKVMTAAVATDATFHLSRSGTFDPLVG